MTDARKMPASAAERKTRRATAPFDRKAAFQARQARIIATQSRPGLSACERLVIAIIGQHENLKTGQCNPGIETIANESGLHERAVYRAIAGAERKGAVVVTRAGNGGRNRPNGYQLVPAKAAENPDNLSGKKTLTKRSKNPDKASPELEELRGEGKAKAFPLAGRENEPYRVLDCSGSGVAPDGAPELVFEERLEPASPPELETGTPEPAAAPNCRRRKDDPAEPSASPPAEDDSGGLHAAWRALVELWAVRPWPIAPRELAIARAIFVKAIAAGTPVDAILAGAGAWVSGVDDPRYLKALPQFLAARGWEHGPPAKRTRPQAGGQRRYQRREKTDLASLMHELGQTM